MDEDMKRRIREKGGDPNESVNSAFFRRGKKAIGSLTAIVSEKIQKEYDAYLAKEEKSRKSNAAYQDRMDKLREIDRRLSGIFRTREAKKFRWASAFSKDLHYNVKYAGEDHTHADRPYYEKPKHIKDTVLLVKFNSRRGISISCTKRGDGFVFSTDSTHYESYLLPRAYFRHDSEPLFTGGWILDGHRYSRRDSEPFESIDSVVDYMKDEIAEAIIDNRKNFYPRLAKRGVKLGFLVSAFLWADSTFAEEADPANDFGRFEPDRDVPELSVDIE